MQKRFFLFLITVSLLLTFAKANESTSSEANTKIQPASGEVRNDFKGNKTTLSRRSSYIFSDDGNSESEPLKPEEITIIITIISIICGVTLILFIAITFLKWYRKRRQFQKERKKSDENFQLAQEAKERVNNGKLVCINNHPLDRHVSEYSEIKDLDFYKLRNFTNCNICCSTRSIRSDFYRCSQDCRFDVCKHCFDNAKEKAIDPEFSDQSYIEKNNAVFKAHGINQEEIQDVENQHVYKVQKENNYPPIYTFDQNNGIKESGTKKVDKRELINAGSYQDEPFNNKQIL